MAEAEVETQVRCAGGSVWVASRGQWMRAGEVSDSTEQRTGLIAAVDMDCFQDVQGDGKRITCVGSQEAMVL